MSAFFENKNRRVIPNFRGLKKTIELGEINSNTISTEVFPKNDISNYYKDFIEDKTIGTAGDFLSAAIVNNDFNTPEGVEVAKFIMENSQYSSVLQTEAAERILDGTKKKSPNIDSIEEFLESKSVPLIYGRIRKLKKKIHLYDRNPFLYSELSRLYSIIGQKDSAIKNIKIARSLSPNNRYILRSYARLMAHFGDIEAAHDILRSNRTTKFDPWLLASEIAFASVRNKSSNFMKIGSEIISNKKFHPFSFSELASAMSTVELFNGSRKKSKSLLQTALLSPNDNSLAQIEWINNKENFFELDIDSVKVSNNFEALTLHSYDSQQWDLTIDNAEKWFIDMPFATRPIIFGHHTASFFLDDQDTGIKFCKAGLISNPNDPLLINNIAFSHAMKNEPTKAFDYLNKIKIDDVKEDHVRVCLLATTGLAYYRNGLPELGRDLYFKSIQEAKVKGEKYYYALALMSITREEIISKTEFAKRLYERSMNIDIGDNIELNFFRKKLTDMMIKHNL